MSMDEVAFHREPPTDVPTMVAAFFSTVHIFSAK